MSNGMSLIEAGEVVCFRRPYSSKWDDSNADDLVVVKKGTVSA